MSRWDDLHVYNTATMYCQACGELWICDGGKARLLTQFANRPRRHLVELLAETAAIAVQVLDAKTDEQRAAIHFRIRDWVGVPRG